MFTDIVDSLKDKNRLYIPQDFQDGVASCLLQSLVLCGKGCEHKILSLIIEPSPSFSHCSKVMFRVIPIQADWHRNDLSRMTSH